MLLLNEVKETTKGSSNFLHNIITLTLNNLSCVFKKSGKLISAQECLLHVQDLDKNNGQSSETSALTCLNLCTIYSSKKQHLQAKKQALKAIQILKEDA